MNSNEQIKIQGESFDVECITRLDPKVGDIVLNYGGVWLVKEVKRFAYNGRDIDTQANICDFLGNIYADSECMVPAHWRQDWNIQGNDLAKLYRII